MRKPWHKSPILIGNAHEYGGARQQQEFVDSHTAMLEYEKPNYAYLYHRVLKKYVDENIARIFLEIYERVNEHVEKNKQIVTARHLTMMAKMFNVWVDQFKDANLSPEQLAIAAAFAVIGEGIKPALRDAVLVAMRAKENYQYDAEALEKAQLAATKKKLELLLRAAPLAEHDFEFAPSRLPSIQLLETHFSVHERYPGEVDFGLLFEGESGIGKSDLVTYYAKLRGVNLLQMTPGKYPEEDKKKLCAAKASNQRVLIDEINAGGENLEQTINTLGTGIIASQNPSSMDGRELLSPALKARFVPAKVSGYLEDELPAIFMKKCKIAKFYADIHARDFTEASNYAEQRGLSPKPNLRACIKGIKEGRIAPRITPSMRTILNNDAFWRLQASGPRCDIPVGVSAMLAAENSIYALQGIARIHLENSGLTFFSSFFRSDLTKEFYNLILAPDEAKLQAFIQKQAAELTFKDADMQWDALAFPSTHILK